jgi:hypothetical protein
VLFSLPIYSFTHIYEAEFIQQLMKDKKVQEVIKMIVNRQVYSSPSEGIPTPFYNNQ